MPTPPKKRSAPAGILEQAVAFLREAIARGRLAGVLPANRTLAESAGVSVGTMHRALGLLVEEGAIVVSGKGRGLRMTVKARRRRAGGPAGALRVGMFFYDRLSEDSSATQGQMSRLIERLQAAGHTPFHALRTMRELRCDPARILASAKSQEADVWIVANAPTPEVLRALLKLPVPVFDLAGARGDNEVASVGIRCSPTNRVCVRHLVALGHRRVVMICAPHMRTPEMIPKHSFLTELTALGIPAGRYNLPDWEFTTDGLQALLRELFRVTPPTAILADDARTACAVLAFAAERGLRVPRDLSLVTMCTVVDMAWMRPRPACYVHDMDLLNARVVDWVDGCVSGTQDRERVVFESVFDPAETVAPPPKG